MIIKKITLTNFRNHASYSLECEDETSLILGENGCGKTSVLEAIYILTRGKSFRATDPEIIKRGSKFYRIELEYLDGEKIIASYDGGVKNFTILDKKTRRLPKKNKYPVILFLPSDLNLISHSPGRRRDYFDATFSSLDDSYTENLSKYKKALKQRNESLKSENLNPADLFSWNLLLARLGSSLWRSRQTYIERINSLLPATYHSIAKNSDQVKILYQSEAENISENKYFSSSCVLISSAIFMPHFLITRYRFFFIGLLASYPNTSTITPTRTA